MTLDAFLQMIYDVCSKYVIIVLSGAFGGILSHIHRNDGKLYSHYKINLSENEKGHIYLGYWGDIILGAGAGLLATLPLDITAPKGIYVALIGGFGGGNFIAKQALKTEEEKAALTSSMPNIPEPRKPEPNNPEPEYIDVELDIEDQNSGGEKK